jgi:hypothetical protein
MLDSYFRPIYQPILLNPLFKLINSTTTNLVAYLLCFLGITTGFLIFYQYRLTAIFLLMLMVLLDALDNIISTDKLNPSASVRLKQFVYRIVELSIFTGLWMVNPTERMMACFLMLASVYLYISVLLAFPTSEATPTFGLIGRKESFAFYFVMILELHYFSTFAYLYSVAVLITTGLHLRSYKNMYVKSN